MVFGGIEPRTDRERNPNAASRNAKRLLRDGKLLFDADGYAIGSRPSRYLP